MVKGDYKCLNTDMLYKLPSIESKHAQITNTLSNLDDSYYDDAPDFSAYYAKRRELYANHGLYVVELSENICHEFEISHTSWAGGFNPAQSIRDCLLHIRRSKAKAVIGGRERRSRRVAELKRKATTDVSQD